MGKRLYDIDDENWAKRIYDAGLMDKLAYFWGGGSLGREHRLELEYLERKKETWDDNLDFVGGTFGNTWLDGF